MDAYEKLVELLKPIVKTKCYLDENGMADNYIDYREIGSVDSASALEELAEYYKECGDIEQAADWWYSEQSWSLDNDDYYAQQVEDECASYLSGLTDEEVAPFTVEELQEEFDNATDVDRWDFYQNIGYNGVNAHAIDYFPDYVTIDVFINPAVNLPYDTNETTVEYMERNCKVICDLLRSGGVSIDEFVDALRTDNIDSLGAFGKSVAQDMYEGWTDVMMWLTASAKVSLEDFCKLASGQATSVSINPGIRCFGLYNPYDGGGTPLEIELSGPFTVSASDVDYQIDMGNKKGQVGWTIDDVYGLVGDAFVEDGITVQ